MCIGKSKKLSDDEQGSQENITKYLKPTVKSPINLKIAAKYNKAQLNESTKEVHDDTGDGIKQNNSPLMIKTVSFNSKDFPQIQIEEVDSNSLYLDDKYTKYTIDNEKLLSPDVNANSKITKSKKMKKRLHRKHSRSNYGDNSFKSHHDTLQSDLSSIESKDLIENSKEINLSDLSSDQSTFKFAKVNSRYDEIFETNPSKNISIRTNDNFPKLKKCLTKRTKMRRNKYAKEKDKSCENSEGYSSLNDIPSNNDTFTDDVCESSLETNNTQRIFQWKQLHDGSFQKRCKSKNKKCQMNIEDIKRSGVSFDGVSKKCRRKKRTEESLEIKEIRKNFKRLPSLINTYPTRHKFKDKLLLNSEPKDAEGDYHLEELNYNQRQSSDKLSEDDNSKSFTTEEIIHRENSEDKKQLLAENNKSTSIDKPPNRSKIDKKKTESPKISSVKNIYFIVFNINDKENSKVLRKASQEIPYMLKSSTRDAIMPVLNETKKAIKSSKHCDNGKVVVLNSESHEDTHEFCKMVNREKNCLCPCQAIYSPNHLS